MRSYSAQFAVVTFMLVLVALETEAGLPSYIKVCKASNPDLAGCIKNSIEFLRPNLIAGMPEFDVPSIETFSIGDVFVKTNINLNMTNMTFSHLTNYKIEDLSADFEKYQFAMLIRMREVKFTGNYAIDNKILSIPLHGEGPMSGSFGSLLIVGKLKGRRTKIDGKTYVKLSFPEFAITKLTDVKLRLDNLFPNNAQLAQAARNVVEDNAQVLIEDLLPYMTENIKEVVLGIADKITLKYTVEELFPN